MDEGTAAIRELIIIYGESENEAQTIDEFRRAMEMYNPVSHSDASEKQCQELVRQHRTSIKERLIGLIAFAGDDIGNIRD